MKKLVSIAFVILILLNVMGYYGLFKGLEFRNQRHMTARLDRDAYDAENAVLIKMPVAIPYAMDQAEFERVEGNFVHQGEVYRLVKQRLAQDTLYIVCVKDDQGTHINNALGDYVKTFADAPSNSSHTVKTVNLSHDYIGYSVSIHELSFGWERDVTSTIPVEVFISDYSVSIIHPPERA